ncbi:DUF1932 domain-containing protein [Specibacter sp. RAF43]|uniref:DUF1932 domain-containing protein n=1 Tax=Specibacter sp. RAF43 TaxID=3233057 RepID=UPI003F9C5766
MAGITITVLGLGEAGRLYAGGLSTAGATVKGYDPYTDARGAGIDQHEDLAAALNGSAVVLSLVGAAAAETVAARSAGHLHPESVYADLNTASPATKAGIARRLTRDDVSFADVAVLAPVPRAGHRTPLLASGPGADALAGLLGPLGVPIASIGGVAGDAAARKLLRSVFMKGLAALVLEATAAGEAAGHGDWLHGQMAAELGPGGADLIERLATGTRAHAERRRHEVQDALDYLRELESPHWITGATLAWISSLTEEGTAK